MSFYAPEDIPKVKGAFQRALEDAEPYDLELGFIRANGEKIWVRTSGKPEVRDGKVVRISGNFMDITERKQMDEKLKLASAYNRSLIEASLDPLVTIDSNGKITDVNITTENITGCPREKLIGMDFSDYFTEPEKAREGYRQVFEKGFVRDYPLAIRHISGSATDVLYNASVYKDAAGNVAGVFADARDITEHKKVEEIRLENERLVYANQAKSEFLASMSHDLRTPVNAIIGFSELLKQKMPGELNEKQEHFVDNVLSSSKHLLALIGDILDIAKIEAGKMELAIEEISVPSVTDDVLVLMKEKAAKHKVILNKEFDPRLDVIEADKTKFKQILFNLLDNAVKFSKEEGGTVTITTKKTDDIAEISVSDTGVGIKEEDIGKLFTKFQQLETGRKIGGTGLGLAISKQLVELHRGTITAESKFGKGSTFTFLLPLKSKKEKR
jgi:PAS domain S-box-containing protein